MGKTHRGVEETPQCTEIIWPSAELKKLLAKIYDSLNSHLRKEKPSAVYQLMRHDFVFHMTDWLNDLKRLNDIYDAPDKVRLRDAERDIIGLLYHVIPHLNAAGRLLLGDVSDPFLESEAEQVSPAPKKKPVRKSSSKAKVG